MEKKEKLKILAIIGVVVMLGGMIAPQMLRWGGGSDGTVGGEIEYGTSTANGTLRTYDRVLFISRNITRDNLDFIKEDEGFENLRKLEDGWILETKTRDDVYPIAEKLTDKKIDSAAIANVVIPGTLDVKLSNGSTIKVQNRGGIARVITRPFLEEDSRVKVDFVAGVSNKLLINISDASIASQEFNKTVNAKVLYLKNKTYTYEIPWEGRDINLEELSDYEYNYDKKDIIIFSDGIPMAKLPMYRSLEYVEYISSSSMSVGDDFTSIEQIKTDFSDIVLETPPSILTIKGSDDPDLGMKGNITHSYLIMLPEKAGELSFKEQEHILDTDRELKKNETLEVEVNGISIGDKAVWVASIRPSWQSS